MSPSKHVNLCSRSSFPTLRSAPPCTVLLIILSSLVVLSQGLYPSQHGTLGPISVTSRLSSHRQISFDYDRRVTLMKRSRRMRPGITSRLRRARVVRPAVSLNRSGSSRRQYSPAAPSRHCSIQRATRSWLDLLVVQPFVVSQRSCASFGLRRRLCGRPQMPIRLGVECKI
jgi:hypothetical protein